MTFSIAHRGLSGLEPENSLRAFERALEHTHVLEVDARCTHDGVIVCTHDRSLERTHGVSSDVGRIDFDELRHQAPEVPRLEEVLAFAHDHDAAVMLDVKVTRPRAIAAIETAVERSGMSWNDGRQLRAGEPLSPRTMSFQSATPELLQSFRARTGAGCVELVTGRSTIRELIIGAPFITAYAQGVTLPDSHATKAVLSVLRRLRLGTYVYTVNDQARFTELAALGADGVYTDRVDVIG